MPKPRNETLKRQYFGGDGQSGKSKRHRIHMTLPANHWLVSTLRRGLDRLQFLPARVELREIFLRGGEVGGEVGLVCVAFFVVSDGHPAQKIRWGDYPDAAEFPERQQMFLVAAHDVIRFRRQGAFQNHFITGISCRSRGAFRGKN